MQGGKKSKEEPKKVEKKDEQEQDDQAVLDEMLAMFDSFNPMAPLAPIHTEKPPAEAESGPPDTEKKEGEFGDNQYWKINDMGYDLDELLADME